MRASALTVLLMPAAMSATDGLSASGCWRSSCTPRPDSVAASAPSLLLVLPARHALLLPLPLPTLPASRLGRGWSAWDVLRFHGAHACALSCCMHAAMQKGLPCICTATAAQMCFASCARLLGVISPAHLGES